MRVAVVGTGGVARRHLGVLQHLPQVQVVAHLSADLRRAQDHAHEWGGLAFTCIQDVLRTARPDAVWICVTPDRHGPLERTLIERGVPFFVEKPLSADLNTAEELAELVMNRDLVVGVGYKFRALDTLARVRELLAEHPPRLVHAVWHDRLPPPGWWRQSARGGGQVVEQATHLLDLARVLVGQGEVIAGAAGHWPRPDAPGSDVPDVSTALLRFAGVPGILSATTLLRGNPVVELQLVCESLVLRLSERRLILDTGELTQEFPTTVDPFLVEDQVFLAAVRGGDPSSVLCTYADALESHRLACRVRDVLESGNTLWR